MSAGGLTRATMEGVSTRLSEPAWAFERRRAAWEAFERLPLPPVTYPEAWRRTDISTLDLGAFALPGRSGGPSHPQYFGPIARDGGQRAGLITHFDGAPGLPDLSEAVARQGVIFSDLAAALREHPELARDYLLTVATPDAHKFRALHAALWSGGTFLYVPKGVEVVGVFVNETPEKVNAIAEEVGLHLAQLHGDETPEQADLVRLPVIKTVRLEKETDIAAAEKYKVDLFLIDTPSGSWGGSGKIGDWKLAAAACRRLRALLAGGLTPDNVAEAVRAVNPYGVDVASGVESAPGIKDREKMKRFIERAREASRAVREKEGRR